jgi:hypothetical protein
MLIISVTKICQKIIGKFNTSTPVAKRGNNLCILSAPLPCLRMQRICANYDLVFIICSFCWYFFIVVVICCYYCSPNCCSKEEMVIWMAAMKSWLRRRCYTTTKDDSMQKLFSNCVDSSKRYPRPKIGASPLTNR